MSDEPSFHSRIPATMILRRLTVSRFDSNCYIVGSVGHREALIVDPGGDDAVIVKCIQELELKVNLIVATHLHIDHYGAFREVKKATGAPFAVHPAEFGEAAIKAHGHPLPKPDRVVKEGDVLSVGEFDFTVLDTPGHSLGGICIAGYNIVFTGDTLLKGGTGKIGSTGTSQDQIEHSIRTKLMMLPDHTIVLPGHGPETTIGAERTNNLFPR